MKKLVQDGIRKVQRLFLLKRKKTGYSSFDAPFRTAYGKEEAGRKRRRMPVAALGAVLRKKARGKEESYKRKEGGRFLPLRLVAGISLLAVVGLLVWYNGGWGGWRTLVPAIPFFQLHHLEFSGCSVTNEAVLRERGGLALYQNNLLILDTVKVEKLIAEDPWVSKVKVKRNWPSGLTVSIIEHTPLALANNEAKGHSGLSYIDRSGVVFMPVSPGQEMDYPVITGLERFKEPKRRQEILADIFSFLKQTEKNDPNLPTESISEIHVNEKGELVIFLVEYPFPIFFGRAQAETKYNRLVKVLEVLYKKRDEGMQILRVDYIRMDYQDDKVLVAQSGSG